MKYAVILITIVLLGIVAFAATKKVSPVGWDLWGTTNTHEGVALKSYDPVSYFGQQEPIKGSASYSHEFANATWHFASAASRDLFAADPQRYAPQFGSFCAFAVSKGFTADSDPEAWYIEDGRLYVFADKNVRDQWVSELGEGSLQRSNQSWAKRD